MDYLSDTNIILRLSQSAHPMHNQTLNAVKKLLSNGDEICLIPQNLIEFWNVATRPENKNGLGWTPQHTDKEVADLEAIFTILPDTPTIYSEWRKLVVNHSVSGKQVHDTRIVAAMYVHKINHLLTFNVADFKRFANIILVNPTSV